MRVNCGYDRRLGPIALMSATLIVIGVTGAAAALAAGILWSVQMIDEHEPERFLRRGIEGRVAITDSGRTVIADLGVTLAVGDTLHATPNNVVWTGAGRALEREVRDWMEDIPWLCQVWISANTLTVITQDHGLDIDLTRLLKRCVDLALSLRARSQNAWERAAADHGLAFGADGIWGEDSDGRRVEIKPIARGTSVKVDFAVPLAGATRIARKGLIKGSQTLDDAILGPMLDISSDDLPAVTCRLVHDDIRAPLLEILHGHPGSCMTEDRFELIIAHRPFDPTNAITIALELAAAVDRHG